MPAHRPTHPARRVVLVGAVTLTTMLALAGPASAHAEVEADTPRALAENVTLTFVSEAESDTAGFTRLRVVLPDGIAPGDVTLDDGPQGWKLEATGDGYTVGGTALETGVDAEHKIKVKQLPDAEQIAFKTVETYGDGEVSRWIELPEGDEEPEQPAPALKLKTAAPGATALGPSSAASATSSTTPSRAAAEAAAEQQAEQQAAEEDEGSPAGLIAGAIGAVLLLLGGGAWWLARRRASSGAH